MPKKKRAAVVKTVGLIDIRLRLLPDDEMEVVKAAAANRGLGFNMFVRLVSVGTAKRVLAEASPEDLIGRHLDPAFVMGRNSLESALD